MTKHCAKYDLARRSSRFLSGFPISRELIERVLISRRWRWKRVRALLVGLGLGPKLSTPVKNDLGFLSFASVGAWSAYFQPTSKSFLLIVTLLCFASYSSFPILFSFLPDRRTDYLHSIFSSLSAQSARTDTGNFRASQGI